MRVKVPKLSNINIGRGNIALQNLSNPVGESVAEPEPTVFLTLILFLLTMAFSVSVITSVLEFSEINCRSQN